MLRSRSENRNVLYSKIKRTIFFVVAVLVVLASALFYQYNISLLTDRAQQADMQILKTHKEASGVMQRLAYNIAQQIYNDPQIAYLLYNTNFNPMEILRSVAQLNNYRSCIPYIESIYVYNAKLASMTVSSPHSGGYDMPVWEADKDRELFFDRDMVDILTGKIRGGNRSSPFPRLIRYPESYNPPVFCYTFVASRVYGEEPLREAVFVNFSFDWMWQITRENAGSESHTLMVNDEGVVVFSAVPGERMRDIFGEPMFQRIVEQGDRAQSFVALFGGEKMLVSVLPADANHWNYIRLTPYAYITRHMLGALMLMLAVDIGLILLGFLTTLIAAKRLYVPIVAIRNRLDDTEKEREQLSRQQLLRKELLGPIVTVQTGGEEAGISGDGAGYILMIRIERHAQARERGPWTPQIVEAARTVFAGEYAVRGLELDESGSVALVLFGETEHGREYWLNAFANIKTRFGKTELRGALSLPGRGSSWKAHGYRQAKEAMRYRILPGQSGLILWESVQALSRTDYAYPQEKENLLIDQILNGNADAAKDILIKIMEKTQGYSLITVQLTISTLTIALLNVTEEIKRSNFVTLPSVVRESLLAVPSLDDVETLEEVSGHFADIVDQMCASLSDRRDAKHVDLLEHINALIGSCYKDPNCSLTFIAQQTNLSAAYVARLYKHYTLRSIPDAILEVRMEHARQLLVKNRELSIEQIALNTGFSGGSYFSKSFRKEHGMSPNEYRSFVLRDQTQQAGEQERIDERE